MRKHYQCHHEIRSWGSSQFRSVFWQLLYTFVLNACENAPDCTILHTIVQLVQVDFEISGRHLTWMSSDTRIHLSTSWHGVSTMLLKSRSSGTDSHESELKSQQCCQKGPRRTAMICDEHTSNLDQRKMLHDYAAMWFEDIWKYLRIHSKKFGVSFLPNSFPRSFQQIRSVPCSLTCTEKFPRRDAVYCDMIEADFQLLHHYSDIWYLERVQEMKGILYHLLYSRRNNCPQKWLWSRISRIFSSFCSSLLTWSTRPMAETTMAEVCTHTRIEVQMGWRRPVDDKNPQRPIKAINPQRASRNKEFMVTWRRPVAINKLIFSVVWGVEGMHRNMKGKGCRPVFSTLQGSTCCPAQFHGHLGCPVWTSVLRF